MFDLVLPRSKNVNSGMRLIATKNARRKSGDAVTGKEYSKRRPHEIQESKMFFELVKLRIDVLPRHGLRSNVLRRSRLSGWLTYSGSRSVCALSVRQLSSAIELEELKKFGLPKKLGQLRRRGSRISFASGRIETTLSEGSESEIVSTDDKVVLGISSHTYPPTHSMGSAKRNRAVQVTVNRPFRGTRSQLVRP